MPSTTGKDDPRFVEKKDNPTANELLLDSAILRAVLLERVKTRNERALLKFLDEEVFPDLLARLQVRLDRISSRGFDSGPITTQRFKDLVSIVDQVVSQGMAEARLRAVDQLSDVAEFEAKAQAASMTRSVGVPQVVFDMPSAATLRELVNQRGVIGQTVKEWFAGIGDATTKKIVSEVRVGIATGDTTQQIVSRVRGTADAAYEDGVLNFTRSNVETFVRTATNHVSTHAREETYRANSDVIKGVQLIVTLDVRTSATCRSIGTKYAGVVFPIGEGPRPPFHPNCRTTTVPVLKSFKDLGIEKETKGLFKDIDEVEEMRASMNGQIPANVTYEQWLEGQSTAIQNEVLGPTKARMWRAGDISMDDMVDRFGRARSVEALKKLIG